MPDNSELSPRRRGRVLLLCLTDDPLDPPGWARFGGGHLFVFDLGRYLVRTGWYVDYLTRRNSPVKPLEESLGPCCAITRLAIGPAEDFLPLDLYEHLEEMSAAAVSFVASREPYDVIHSHNWLSGAVARKAAGQSRHIHSILSLGRVRLELGEEAAPNDPLRDALELEIFRNADTLVTVAPSERDDLRRLYPEIKHDRIAVVPYGVDPDIFNPRPEHPDSLVLRSARRSA
jgi:glycosyltransferase involved in cell wall biosynthesis